MSDHEERLQQLFRHAFRRQAAAVSVLSYVDVEGRPCGMTATAVVSVSLSPPTLLACVNRSTKTRERILSGGWFGLNLLSLGQQEIAAYCSRPGVDKVLPREWMLPAADECRTPALRSALAHCDCEVMRQHDETTHSIIIGRARRVWLGAHDRPLVYFDGAYVTADRGSEHPYEAIWEQAAFACL